MIWVYIPFQREPRSKELFQWGEMLANRQDVKGLFGWGPPFGQLQAMGPDDVLWVTGHTNATSPTMSCDHRGRIEIGVSSLRIRIFDGTAGGAAPTTLKELVLGACEAGQNPNGFAQLFRSELRGYGINTNVIASTTNLSSPDELGGRLFHISSPSRRPDADKRDKRRAIVQFK